jgi:spermidine synthase
VTRSQSRRAAQTAFLAAYTCSGVAGLIYEVSWTRLLTLHIGHTTAAASAVVAAFMGGLALGAAIAGRFATRLTLRQCLYAYAILEASVAVIALVLPLELRATTPLLAWAYRDGASGLLFPTVRLAASFLLILAPAVALGATFPIAVRWFTSRSAAAPAPNGGMLYALNTGGAAAGALVSGFVLIPAAGLSGSIRLGVAISAIAAAAVLAIASREHNLPQDRVALDLKRPPRRGAKRSEPVAPASPTWLAAATLGISGFASLLFEIVWTRVLAMTIGPTTYAFAATVAALIFGLAVGSAGGAWMASRARDAVAWLAGALAGAAAAVTVASYVAGGAVPRAVAERFAAAPEQYARLSSGGVMLAAALVIPAAVCLGAAFPLALATLRATADDAPRRFGIVYAVNTIGSVAGSLSAGFVAIPRLGLQHTTTLVAGLLVVGSVLAGSSTKLRTGPSTFLGAGPSTALGAGRSVSLAAAFAAVVLLVLNPAWDRQLLASGAYMYAPYVPGDLDLITQLKAGSLMYYREGAAATVSVKRLTGTLSLAIDGKTDASNRSDMLTQRVIAHLPLLLHPQPRTVFIIGMGSGVTLGSALRHGVERVDVAEISPEVLEASRYFATENHHALADSRARVIVADGRTHLGLAQQKYDVIVSEPSNPWIAGVAALFTREFFEAARARLAPGGVICQWANIYNISDRDLRAIAATFTAVFPHGTLWLVGENDALFVAADEPIDGRFGLIARGWSNQDVAADLAAVGAVEPFALWSLFAGGPAELARYGQNAAVLDDDRMRLEFSAPRDVHGAATRENASIIRRLLADADRPAPLRAVFESATAVQWRNRGAMMFRSDFFATAYDDFSRALAHDPSDVAALEGFARSAVMARRPADALEALEKLPDRGTAGPAVWVARSKLMAATGAVDAALAAAERASAMEPIQIGALEQEATLVADAGDALQLGVVVERLKGLAPESAVANYFEAVRRFLRGDVEGTIASAERAIAADREYAPTYDLLGAARTKQGQAAAAREAFEASLRLNAHDSTAYTNLGVLALAEGDRRAAVGFFAEALWLDPNSRTAREGLAQAGKP